MAKSQAEIDDDTKYRNRFRDGGNDEPMARHKKRAYNRATGEHQKPATEVDSKKWWRGKVGTDKKGSGALAKRRRKVVDSNIEKAGG